VAETAEYAARKRDGVRETSPAQPSLDEIQAAMSSRPAMANEASHQMAASLFREAEMRTVLSADPDPSIVKPSGYKGAYGFQAAMSDKTPAEVRLDLMGRPGPERSGVPGSEGQARGGTVIARSLPIVGLATGPCRSDPGAYHGTA